MRRAEYHVNVAAGYALGLIWLSAIAHASEPEYEIDQRSVNGKIELVLTSSEAFRFGAYDYYLQIDDGALNKNHFPDDGNPKVLIFLIDPAQYVGFEEGVKVNLFYGSDPVPSQSIPRFTKSLAPAQLEALR